jgi:hypothetical protein
MIKKVYKILAITTLILVTMVVGASAQEPTRTKNVRIDFDFYAGKKLMPAGDYIVSLMQNGNTQKLILVQQQDGNSQAIIASVPNRNKTDLKPGAILFNKYGSQYFLAGVQLGGSNILHSAIKTRAERNILREIAKNGSINNNRELVRAGTDR